MNTLEYENYHEVKDHYENEFSYNTYPCTIPLDFPQVPLHWHNEMELIYVKKGSARISINMQDYIVRAGSIALVLPGYIHGISLSTPAPEARPVLTNSDKENDSNNMHALEYENIIYDLNMLLPKQSDDMTTKFFQKLLDPHTICPCVISPETVHFDNMVSCIDRADSICQNFPAGYRLAVRSCLYEFFFYINQLLTTSSAENAASPEFLERMKTIMKYVELHYGEEITIQKMADICNISHSHFMKFFKTHMGTSFVDYLNDYRLLTASRMLTTSDDSITEIAGKCGFDNVSYFNRLFKKKYHVTPKQMR